MIESKQKVQSTIEKTQKMDGIMNQVELVSVSTLEAIQLYKECSLLYKELIEIESQERYHKISSIQLPYFYKNPKVWGNKYQKSNNQIIKKLKIKKLKNQKKIY